MIHLRVSRLSEGEAGGKGIKTTDRFDAVDEDDGHVIATGKLVIDDSMAYVAGEGSCNVRFVADFPQRGTV